ncbi:MAG: hypothetical protein AABW67_05245 [Nanoarchaeota archaeon]
MIFPYKIQRSIDKHIEKEVRKNICREDFNLITYFHRKNNPKDGERRNYHNAMSRIYSQKANMYTKFKDWKNYHTFLNLSIEEGKQTINYSLQIWQEAY